VTTFCTKSLFTEVKIFATSGIIAPAVVPQLIISESFHQKVPSPKSPITRLETIKINIIETIEVIHTRDVKGASKSIFFKAEYLTFAIIELIHKK
jgi:hypothetical protein